MRENRPSGSEGGGPEQKLASLPLFPSLGPIRSQKGNVIPRWGPICPRMGIVVPQMGIVVPRMGPIFSRMGIVVPLILYFASAWGVT